jgi:hypothetical protein
MGRKTKLVRRGLEVDHDPAEFIRARILWPLLCDIFGRDEARQKLTEAYNTGSVQSVRLIVRAPYVWLPSAQGSTWKSAQQNDPAFCRGHELLFPSSYHGEVSFRWAGRRAYDFADINKTFLKGYTQRDLVDEVLRVMKKRDGVEEGAISGLSDQPAVRGFFWAGLARELMNYIATRNNACWSIKDRKLNHIPGRRAEDPIDMTPKWELLFLLKDVERVWPLLKTSEEPAGELDRRPGPKAKFEESLLRTIFIRLLHQDDAGKSGLSPNFSAYSTQIAELYEKIRRGQRQPSTHVIRAKLPGWYREFLDSEPGF